MENDCEKEESIYREKADVSATKGKYLTFLTDGQLFGLPIAQVEQIIGIQEIIRIPEFPVYAKGIINLRNSMIPVMDLRIRLNREEVPYNERTCIIVTKLHEKPIGIIVDEVSEVTKIKEENIAPPPIVSENESFHFLSGIAKLDNHVVLLLNTSSLFDSSVDSSEITQNNETED